MVALGGRCRLGWLQISNKPMRIIICSAQDENRCRKHAPMKSKYGSMPHVQSTRH
eukprot:CAMPEP_0185901000 /NCGR_PEP_ID=MMETSP0196C-20130402/418_1 /TAXON_ID=2932 /ORGANISM="Alexandrium fundyense, Strain CCMP1719" /LENGTH=54 /DNA_ID=CAMNT_0028619573 /DNA_START=10 /DNA_END=171 /DNA_ORIENTATION=-